MGEPKGRTRFCSFCCNHSGRCALSLHRHASSQGRRQSRTPPPLLAHVLSHGEARRGQEGRSTAICVAGWLWAVRSGVCVGSGRQVAWMSCASSRKRWHGTACKAEDPRNDRVEVEGEENNEAIRSDEK